jgi:2-dehydropantoate 2-reductase
MKVCIFGAGAIGGYIGTKLALSGADVSVVARGPNLAAIKEKGLRLLSEGQTYITWPRATDNTKELGAQDFVVICVKAHALVTAADSIKPLLGPNTTLIPAVNGVPWWYFYKLPGPHENARLKSVDPNGQLWEKLPPSRVVGCIVYPATELLEPGVIEHTYGNRFEIGEPDGSKSDRATAFSQVMIRAGLRCPVRPRIRDNLWIKLWGNLSFNPICALTLSTMGVVARDPGARAVARAMMLEAQAIAEKLGVQFPIDVDARIAGAAEVGEHKPSTLVDLERGRPMEIDALLGAVVEMGQLVGLPTPTCDVVFSLVRQLARSAGCYEAPSPSGSLWERGMEPR